jgi:hypothetical protein
VGCMRLCGAVDGGPCAGASALRLRSFDENMPPVHLDSIRAAAVDGSEPETHTVASRLDGMGADASRLDDLGCGAHTCLSGVAGLVVDMDGMRAVGPGGGESDACAGASSTGITVNPLVVVVYSPLTVRSVSDTPVSTNRVSRDVINMHVVGSSSLYPRDLSAHHPSIRHLTDAASRTPWLFRLITSTLV